MPRLSLRNLKIGVVGLGYVGLPLAVEFGRRYVTIGYDIKAARIRELRQGNDSTRAKSSAMTSPPPPACRSRRTSMTWRRAAPSSSRSPRRSMSTSAPT
jgi:hypothetical protein